MGLASPAAMWQRAAVRREKWRLKNAKLKLPRTQPVVDDRDRAAPRASDVNHEANEEVFQDSGDSGEGVALVDHVAAKQCACLSEVGSDALETATCFSDDSSDSGWSMPSKNISCSDRSLDCKAAF